LKKYLPLIIGLIALTIVLLLPMKSKLLEVFAILFAIPLVTYQMRDKEAGDLPYQGALTGGIIGCFSCVVLDYFLMNLIYHDMAKHSIRFDFLLAGVLGTSIGSTIGIIKGGNSKKKEADR